ncbi:hypothetical protein ACYULU_07990 [Breznakiellaceae bacterium SP9]
MGWKGTARSFMAIARAYERDAIRTQKELARQQKEYDRLSALEQAALEVKQYENYIDRLLSVHKDCCDEYNWVTLEKAPPPSQPSFRDKPELKIIADIHDSEHYYQGLIDNYKPGIFEKLFGINKRKIKKWSTLLENGRAEDLNKTQVAKEQAANKLSIDIENWNKECEQLKEKYKNDYEEWAGVINLAKSINQGEPTSYLHAVKEIAPFNEISDFGSKVYITICSATRAKASIDIHDDTVIPKQSKSLLKSGKVSVKDMPIGKFNEIYQDYICSVSLRIARDLFAIIPVEEIIVTAKGNCLNTSNGKTENLPLLSVLFIRETINTINFDAIDPSDAMKNFKCNMSFKKSLGMNAVKELDFLCET